MSNNIAGAARRARHRDNAAKLGKFQLAVEGAARSLNGWLDTPKGQVTLLLTVVVALVLAALIPN